MAEGQFTGKRAYYIYTAEGGRQFLIQTDKTLGDIANNGLVAANKTNAANIGFPPKRFQPRGVHWQGELNDSPVRKFIICGTSAASLYASVASVALTIDGVSGGTTGRRGEKFSFVNLPDAPTEGGGTPG